MLIFLYATYFVHYKHSTRNHRLATIEFNQVRYLSGLIVSSFATRRESKSVALRDMENGLSYLS